jgi:hypothetical protein
MKTAGLASLLGCSLLLGCTAPSPTDDSDRAGLERATPAEARSEAAPSPTASPTPESTAPEGPCIAAVDADNLEAENLAKYFSYRERFRHEFIHLSAGDEPGTNLAANVRQGTTLVWGDSTIMHAQYLAMLATEHAILAGRDPAADAQTLRELHWALRTLDRLDRVAESYFRPDRSVAEGDLNGFFVRDDVDADFLSRTPIDGATAIASGVTEPYGGDPAYFSTEMSQDQVWHLLMGLALVKKLAPYVGDIDGEQVDLRAHAKTITDRILRYMRDHDRWRTQNPIFGVDVLRGAEMDARRVFSYGFAEAGNFILGQDAPDDPRYASLHDTASLLAEPFFRLASVVESDNYHQRVLATVGDINYAVGLFAWGGTLWKLEHETISRTLFRYEHFPLVYVLLHGGSTRVSPQLYGGLLNAAPADGPFNHGDAANVCAWSSPSRLVWPESNESPEAWIQGDYNGLDYLLMHNLYQLVFAADRLDALYTR